MVLPTLHHSCPDKLQGGDIFFYRPHRDLCVPICPTYRDKDIYTADTLLSSYLGRLRNPTGVNLLLPSVMQASSALAKREGSLAWRCPSKARGVTCQQENHGSDYTEGGKRLEVTSDTFQESIIQSPQQFLLSPCVLCKVTRDWITRLGNLTKIWVGLSRCRLLLRDPSLEIWSHHESFHIVHFQVWPSWGLWEWFSSPATSGEWISH